MAHTVKKGMAVMGQQTLHAGISLGDTLKDTFSRHEEYHPDDELLKQYEHDLKASSKALRFISGHVRRMNDRYWKFSFLRLEKTVLLWQQLTGATSLAFEGMEEYHEQLDRLHMAAEGFSVHPKERELVVESVDSEVGSYIAMAAALRSHVMERTEAVASFVKGKNSKMEGQLAHSYRALKVRRKIKRHAGKLRRKTDRLAKKTSPLEASEHLELEKLQQETETATKAFEAANDAAKTILPQILALFEEYIDSISKYLVCTEEGLYKDIYRGLEFYAVHQGFTIGDYEKIVSEWEEEVSESHGQAEALVGSTRGGISDSDENSKSHNAWNLLKEKFPHRNHAIKAKDHENGVFADYIMADPLSSFRAYNDPSVNECPSYHPKEMVDAPYAGETITRSLVLSPPPLPPRDDLRRISVPIGSPVVNNHTPLFTQIPLSRTASSDSLSSLPSDSELSLSTARSDEESDGESSVVLGSDYLNRRGSENARGAVAAMYNGGKNDIISCPVTAPFPGPHKTANAVFAETNSVSYRLTELSKFFQIAVKKSSENPPLFRTAHKSFSGDAPGDVSFEKGDRVQILLDLQQLAVSANQDGANWVVAAVPSVDDHPRIGFAPNTYLL